MKKVKTVFIVLVVVLIIVNIESLDKGYKKLMTAFRGNVTVEDLYTDQTIANIETITPIDKFTIETTNSAEKSLEIVTEMFAEEETAASTTAEEILHTQAEPERKTTAYYDSYGVRLNGGYSIGESSEYGFSVQDSDGIVVAEIYVELNRGGSPTFNEAQENYVMEEMPKEKEFIYRYVAYTDDGRVVTCILSFDYCATIYDESGVDLYWNGIMDFDVN